MHISLADLRDDKQFFVDHPGAVPITTAQVWLQVVYCPVCSTSIHKCFEMVVKFVLICFCVQLLLSNTWVTYRERS
jgi:hypothetical protein